MVKLASSLMTSQLPRHRCLCLIFSKQLCKEQKRCFSKKSSKNGSTRHLSAEKITEKKPTDQIGHWTAGQRKKTTLDDFFSNLVSSSSSAKPSRRSPFRTPDTKQNGEKNCSSSSRWHASEGETTQKVDMNAFFDEVNDIMAKKMEKEQQQKDVDDRTAKFRPSASILDLLPPARSRSRGPDAYDEEAYDQYVEIIDAIVEDPVFLRKRSASRLDEQEIAAVFDWLRADEPVVQYALPAIATLSTAEWNVDKLRNDLRGELNAQQNVFLENLGWNQAQYQLAVRTLLRLGNLCAKKAIGYPAEIGWEKMKEAGYKLDQDTVQNYLYVTSTFCARDFYSSAFETGSILDFLGDGPMDAASSSSSSDGPQRPIVETADIANEVALCHDALFGSSEQSTSIRVRRLVTQKKAAEAERLLNRNASDELRLRTYDPVLQCYLEQNDVASAFNLYVKMRSGDTVHLKPETYIQLMSGIAENGYFRPDAPPIDRVKSLGYCHSSGPKLFDELCEELADDAVEISAAAAKRLYNAIVKGFDDDHGLEKLHLLQSFHACSRRADATELVASRVSLDETTGECPRTGVRLRLINLDDKQKERLKDGLHYLARTAYEERSGKPGLKAEENLKDFGAWLTKRADKPFTAIVDGPNVGYYFQNFDQGTFNFHQIQFIVDALESMGENVLVILPKKYTQKSFMLTNSTGRRRQYLSEKELEICDRLVSSGKAFVVPPSFLDDYYWMYASVIGQGEKWTTEQQYVPPDNAEGRWPGIRPMLVSNDKMRDHKLSLLEPRLFRRWYSNFIVNFTFSAFVGDQCIDKEIGFRTADFYSREIQGNPAVDENCNKCATAWHFPVSDWDENESFCIRIPL